MSITIRKLQASDKEQWLALWRGYQAFYEADLSADEDALFDRLLLPETDGPFCLIAEEKDRLLGLTQFLYHKTTWGPEPRCYLNDLFTVAEARGKGVGTLLIEAVEKQATTDGASQVYWLTQDFNDTARSLYDKVGKLTPFIKYMR